MKSLPLFETMSLYVNGSNSIIVMFLLFFGVKMATPMIEDFDWKEITHLQSNTSIGKGKILRVFETNMGFNDVSIYGYEYIFYSPEGNYTWISYHLGLIYSKGDPVTIEYSNSKPDINRIKGMTNTPGGLYSFFFLCPFLIGLVWMIVNIINGHRKYQIIVNGEITNATLIDKTEECSSDDEKVFKLLFKFTCKNGDIHLIKHKTPNPKKLEDEIYEKIIYLKEDPEKALVVDSLPWTVPTYIKRNWC